MIADLYDFDGTVFDGESGSEFMIFCIKRHPKLIKYLPKTMIEIFRCYALKKGDLAGLKNVIYRYLKDIDAEKEAEAFWEENAHRMNPWFKPNEQDVPVVICSASPVFQIKPICDRLGVSLVIATDMDAITGKLNDINCKGENKLEYIKKYAPDYTFRDVYTDSIKNDTPILNLAQRDKYLVEKGKLKKI